MFKCECNQRNKIKLLVARYYIWICKNKKAASKVEDFLQYLISNYLFEDKAGYTPSLTPLPPPKKKSGNF